MSTPVAVAAAPALRVGKAGFAIGIAIVGVIALAALFGNALIPQDPFVQDLGKRLVPPFWMEGSRPEHLLGTDQLGRDYLARLVYGARISLLIGIMTVITSGLIGITLGVLGGFFGGRIDDVVLFAITTRLSIPVVLVALAVVGLMGSGLGLVVATLGLLLWDRFAVVARATTQQVRNLDYVNAAWCAGASTPHILIKEILPNISSHLAVVATLEMALAILLEAALSFLGLGVPPPLPSWGLMIAEGKDYMFFSRLGDHDPRRRARASWCSASTWSATGCATCSARSGCGERAARDRRPRGDLRPHRGGARRLAAGREGRDALPGRRVRLRQVGHGARRHEPARARRASHGEAHELRRHRSAVALGPRDGAHPRQPHVDDLPGADDEPQSGLHGRLADGRGADAPQGRLARRRAGTRGRADGPRRHHGAGIAARPVSAPALGRACASA